MRKTEAIEDIIISYLRQWGVVVFEGCVEMVDGIEMIDGADPVNDDGVEIPSVVTIDIHRLADYIAGELPL